MLFRSATCYVHEEATQCKPGRWSMHAPAQALGPLDLPAHSCIGEALQVSGSRLRGRVQVSQRVLVVASTLDLLIPSQSEASELPKLLPHCRTCLLQNLSLIHISEPTRPY